MQSTTTQQRQTVAICKARYRTIRPFKVRWHGRDYHVADVSEYHTTMQGGVLYHVFSVNGGNDFFELKFTDEEIGWFLGDI